MGGSKSREACGSPTDYGLLPLNNLIDKHFYIENLTFQDGRSRAYAYAGAIDVLEKVGILKNLKRVSGVGSGAIVATLLACRFPREKVQEFLLKLLDESIYGDPTSCHAYKPTLVTKLGWDQGDKLFDMIGKIISNKFKDADITFSDLYDITTVELCVVVTNVNSLRAEYWHRKTAPDMRVRDAVYMSLTLPGIHCPKLSSRYGSPDSKCVYVTGSLLCSNPVHSFDGWWLSMHPNDDFFFKYDSIPRIWSDKEKFTTKNPRSLGFVLLSKRDERVYPEFMERLADVGADIFTIPDNELGRKYKKSLRIHQQIEGIYETVQQATEKIVAIIGECIDYEISFEQTLAQRISGWNSILTTREQLLLFSKSLPSVEDCQAVFKEIANGFSFTPALLIAHIQRIAMSMMDDYTFKISEEVNDIPSYLGNVVQTISVNTSKINENDRKRTVGIFYGHVTDNLYLEDVDQTFLYKQGWNATVAYLVQREDFESLASRLNPRSD